MGFDTQDKEIVRLLTKLKDADGKYPPDLLAARRQGYLKQMGQIGLGIGAGIKIKNALNSAKAPALASATSRVLESALVVAIVAETGAVAGRNLPNHYTRIKSSGSTSLACPYRT